MSLTDEECDALLAWDSGIHLEWLAVEEVSGRMWRRSQGQGPGSMVVRLETTFGMCSTLDSLTNMENVAEMGVQNSFGKNPLEGALQAG